MVYSSSYIYAQERHGDGLYFFRRHIVFLIAGFLLMTVVRFIDYRFYRKLALPGFIISLIGMGLVMIPGLGNRAGGATRWLDLGFMTFQPVEFAKVALLIFMARRFTKEKIDFKDPKQGFLYLLWPPLALAMLCLLQPDFGSASLVMILTAIFFFVAGVKLRFLGASMLLALPAFYFAIVSVPYRRARLFAYLDPWADPQNSGFQIIQSFLAFHRGGLFGVGLGNSKEKLFYLPEAHNDFILSVVGEELGFIGMCLLCAVFMALIFRAVRIAAKAEDAFGSLLASGIATLLGLEVFLNAGIVLGLLPTKGMNMPLISSGGSSTIAALIAVGILLSISSQVKPESEEEIY
jgi:cell division protein FtsW